MIIEEQNQSQFPIDENQSENNQSYKREPDEESSFSMFSVFKDFKNSPLYKNRKEICFNLLLSLIVILAAIGALFLIYKTWDSITDFFAEFFKALTEPQRIIEGIWGFISSIIFGSVRYFYISIPLILLIVVFVIYLRKYLFKKRCKKIMEKILEYLKNNENRENNIITEDDIYRQFVQGYGVSHKEFKNKYLKQLDRMRRDYSLKAHSNDINGKKVNYWDIL
jgi:NADH:ubiquinone oxidoreductase subunit 5 (subunit L)/multisubunit Na+/H+ antiporter MnhA subunit